MAGDADLCTMEARTTRPTLATMPAHARVWVYKSAIPFSATQRAVIEERGAAFAGSWATHGTSLFAAVEMLNDHFVVLTVDERRMMASGCSIDSSVKFIQKLENELGLQLTDRMVVLYEKDGAISTCRVSEVEEMLKKGEVTGDTIVFDDLVSTKADLDTRFRTPLRNTWMARYL